MGKPEPEIPEEITLKPFKKDKPAKDEDEKDDSLKIAPGDTTVKEDDEQDKPPALDDKESTKKKKVHESVLEPSKDTKTETQPKDMHDVPQEHMVRITEKTEQDASKLIDGKKKLRKKQPDIPKTEVLKDEVPEETEESPVPPEVKEVKPSEKDKKPNQKSPDEITKPLDEKTEDTVVPDVKKAKPSQKTKKPKKKIPETEKEETTGNDEKPQVIEDTVPVPDQTEHLNESPDMPERTHIPKGDLQKDVDEAGQKDVKKTLKKRKKPTEKEEIEKPSPQIEEEIIQPKKPSEKQKLIPQLMKIERKEVKPTKVKVVDVTSVEDLPLFAQIKLKKAPVTQKRESTSVVLPKVLLKSNIKFINYPPEEHKPVITLLDVHHDKGILSRNTEEALKLQKKKVRKVKLRGKEETDLEIPEDYSVEEEIKPTEKEKDEKPSWDKIPKKSDEEKTEPKKLVVGKGKVPMPEAPLPEDIKLKKIPTKSEEQDETEKSKPKPDVPEEKKRKPIRDEKKIDIEPFQPEDIPKDDVVLETYERTEPEDDILEKPSDAKKKRPKPKKEKPEPEVIQIPLVPGEPRKPDIPEDEDVSFRKKMGKPEPEIPEEITLKPFKKDKSAIDDSSEKQVIETKPTEKIGSEDEKEQITKIKKVKKKVTINEPHPEKDKEGEKVSELQSLEQLPSKTETQPDEKKSTLGEKVVTDSNILDNKITFVEKEIDVIEKDVHAKKKKKVIKKLGKTEITEDTCEDITAIGEGGITSEVADLFVSHDEGVVVSEVSEEQRTTPLKKTETKEGKQNINIFPTHSVSVSEVSEVLSTEELPAWEKPMSEDVNVSIEDKEKSVVSLHEIVTELTIGDLPDKPDSCLQIAKPSIIPQEPLTIHEVQPNQTGETHIPKSLESVHAKPALSEQESVTVKEVETYETHTKFDEAIVTTENALTTISPKETISVTHTISQHKADTLISTKKPEEALATPVISERESVTVDQVLLSETPSEFSMSETPGERVITTSLETTKPVSLTEIQVAHDTNQDIKPQLPQFETAQSKLSTQESVQIQEVTTEQIATSTSPEETPLVTIQMQKESKKRQKAPTITEVVTDTKEVVIELFTTQQEQDTVTVSETDHVQITQIETGLFAGAISVPTLPKKEQVSPTIPEEKQTIDVTVVESQESEVIHEADDISTTETSIIEEGKITIPAEEEVSEVPKKVSKKKKIAGKTKTAVEEKEEISVTEDIVPETVILEKGTPSVIPYESVKGIQVTPQNLPEEFVPQSLPSGVEAKPVEDKPEMVVLETRAKVLERRPSKKEKVFSEKTAIVSGVEAVEEMTGEIHYQKAIPEKTERVITLKESVEIVEVVAETDSKPLHVVEKPAETTIPVEVKEESASISEVQLISPSKKPSKKKKKETDKPQMSKEAVPEEKTYDILPEKRLHPEKAEKIVPIKESIETTQVVPETTTTPLVEEKPTEEVSKPSVEVSAEDAEIVSKPDVKAPVKKVSKKRKGTSVVKEGEVVEKTPETEDREEIPAKESDEEESEVSKPDTITPEEKVSKDKKTKDKLPKPQKIGPVPQLMKIERKEIKPTKLKVTEVATKEEVPLFAQVKLRKSSIQKREIKTTELPKVMLKSNLKVIEYPPLEQTPVVTLINVKPDRGILSRNTQEALKLKKQKVKRVKLTDKDELELEEPESFEMPEDEKPEGEEEKLDIPTWERTPKKLQIEDVTPKKLVIGKGKVPEILEEKQEEIKLKKIPDKPQEEDTPEIEKSKKKEPDEQKVRDAKEKRRLEGLAPFVGENIEDHDLELEKYEKVEPEKLDKESPIQEKPKRPKKKVSVPEPEVVEIPLVLGKPKKPPEEEEKDITLKKKMGEPVPDVPEEITLKPFKKDKPEETPEDKTIKPPKQKSEDKIEDDEQVTMKIQREKSPEKKKIKEKKPKVEEKPEEIEETISMKIPTPQIVPEEIAEEVTLKKVKVEPEVEEEITLKKKPVKPIVETSEEIVIRKIRPVKKDEDVEENEEVIIRAKPREPQQEVTEAVTLKKKKIKKPEIEEVAQEISIKRVVPQEPDETEEVSEVVLLKPAPKKPEETSEEVSGEITVNLKERETQPEEVLGETITLKKKKPKKPITEEVTEEVTLKKERPLPEDIEEQITLKKEKEMPTEEVSEELTVTKLVPRKLKGDDEVDLAEVEKPEEITEVVIVKKVPKRKQSVEEISEEVTLKPKPKKKVMPDVTEITEVETVMIKPCVTKTKEEIEQEFKIQLQTYEEEDISMSSRVRLKKQKPKTYGEEAGEQTIRITQEIEQEKPEEIVEIEEEVPEEGITIELKRKPSYRVEEPEEEEIIHLGQPRRPSEDVEGSFQVQLRRKQEAQQSYTVEEVEEEFQIGLKKEILAPRGSLYEEESLELKLKPKEKPPRTLQQEAVSLSITRETEVFEEGVEEVVVTEYEEGDKFYSLCSYVADNEDALNLVEGERVYILETHNSDWWFVRKHLTEQKGWVPAQLLMDEPSYTLYVQKKLHEKIDKLPVFEKAASEEKVCAPRFVEKLQPRHAPDGVTVQFECQVEGNPRPQIAWFKQTAIILPSQDFQMYYDDDNVATLIIKEAFPEDAGTYTCVAKNAAGFASSSTEFIVEGPLSDHGSESTLISRKSLSRESSLADILEGIPPIFSRKPQPLCVAEGTDVEIECRLVAVPEPDVVWNFGTTKVQTKENITVINESDMHMYTSILRIKNVKKAQEGVYEVVAQNREGESKVSITLKVKTGKNEPPQILEPLKCTTVDEGDGVILSTQIIGNPSPKISWLKDSKPVEKALFKSDEVTHTLTLPKTLAHDAGLYTVQAKNSVGSAETTASLNVRECPGDKMEPPLFTERFQEVKVPEKGKLHLIAKVTGKPVPKITWLRNNVTLKPSPHIKESFDGENITLEISDVNSEVDAGDYKCIASNPVGKASHGAKVSVDVERVSFTKLLEKVVNVDERETLSLECETSHTVSTKWFHNDIELSGMDHRMVIQEGRTHRLVIKETKLRDTGTYKCTVKNQATESTVNVLEGKPDFTRKLQDLEVKERELAVLEVEVSSETADVTWHKDGEQIRELNEKFVFEKQGASRRLFIRGTSVHDEGEYTCVLGEQECTADVTVVELPPEIITKMQDVTIAKGEKATFEIELTKGDALVRWFKDGKELQFSEHVQLSIDGKRQKLKVYNSELEDSGEYSCQVGEQTSSACLTVEEPVVEFITRLPDVTLIPLNTDATFIVELSRPDVEVKWLKKGKEIKPSDPYIILSEGSVRKLIIKKVTLDDQTEYTCMAVNVKTSSKLKVEIIETVPKINMETFQPIYKVKKGEDVDITVQYTATPTPKEEWFVSGKLVKKSRRVTSTLTENSVTLTIKLVEETDVGNYTIKLVNNCGEASAELTLVLMEVPSQPGIPEVVEITNSSVTLHWKAPESDGNSPIINYIIEFHDRSDFTWVKVNANYNIVETTHKITELVHNEEYMFRVTAVNEVGPSQPSHNTQYLKITAPVQAEAPAIQEPLKSIVIGLHQRITLSCVIGGIPAPQIKWLKDGKIFKSKNITYENRISKYTISESTESNAGFYCCQATNDAGFAETSCEVKIQEPPKIEYDETLITQKLRVTNQWKIEVKFSGYPKPDAQWTKNGKSLASTKHCTTHVDEYSSTIAIYSLNKTDSGTYTFSARNEAGARSVDFTVRVIDKPSKPEGPMVVKDIRRESVIIEWKPPADDGGLELSKYSVEKCDVEKMVWMKVADVEKDVSSYCVQQLKEDAEYMFRVIAENPVGSSEALESDTITIRSKFDKPSPPRGPLDISGMTETAFIVTWQPPESDGGAPILEYIVERREVGKKAWQRIGSTTGEVTHIEVSGLKHNVSYHFRVTARNDVGVSAPFAPEEPVTAGKRISAPSAPTHFIVADITSKSVTLQWSPPLSTGGTELTGYIVEKRLASAKKWTKVVTLEPSVTQHCIENLKEKSEWFFRVYAENSIGLSPPASTELVSLKTHASPPSPPTAPLEIRSIGPNSIIIEWGIPETDGGAPIEGYTIAIRDIKKTMWMEVGRVKADVQKLAIKDLQENHEYLIRIFARNEVGLSEPLESDEPFKVLRPTDAEQLEVDKLETTAPTLSFSTETTTSWMREAGMDADIHSYARGSLLRRDEYFFRIWYYARQLFK